MVSLAPLEITVTADTARAEAGLERVQGQLQDTGQAATRSAGRVRTAGLAMGAVGPAAAKANPALRNMSMQLSQVAQQGAVTGNYLQALITQVPDLALGFGAVGIAAGALVPIVYGVAQGFLSADDSGKTLDETLDELASSVSNLKSLTDLSKQSWSELTEVFGANAAAARENILLLTELAGLTAINELKNTTSALSDELGNVVTRYVELEGRGGHTGRVITQSFNRMREELGLSESQLISLDGLFDDLGAAETLDDATRSAQALTDFLERVYGSADQIPPRLREAAQAAAQAANAGYEIEGALDSAGGAAYSVRDAINAITDATGGAIGAANGLTTAWGNVATNAWEAAKAMAAARVRNDGMTGSEVAELAGQYAAYGQGRQAFDQAASDIRYAPPAPNTVTAGAGGGGGGGGSGGGGGGGVNPIIAELEAVQQALMTQEELQIQSFERQQETLQSALEQRMLTQNQYNELMQAAQEQHAAAMTEIDAYRYGSQLDMAETFFGDAANALASGNDKMVEISRKFAAIEATINAGRAFAQVASDPKLPWFAKIPAALGVASAISQFASSSGIGSASAAAAAPAAAAQAQEIQQVSNFNVVIEGQSISASQFGGLIDQINEEARNGGRIFIRAIEG